MFTIFKYSISQVSNRISTLNEKTISEKELSLDNAKNVTKSQNYKYLGTLFSTLKENVNEYKKYYSTYEMHEKDGQGAHGYTEIAKNLEKCRQMSSQINGLITLSNL